MWIIGNTLTIISRNTDSSPFDKCYVTIQYTKTTDQANSFNFGNTTDYSTEEKIVGTWIDGSYIYQKTYVEQITNNQTKSISLPSDIDKAFINNGFYYYDGDAIPLNAYFSSSSYTQTYITSTKQLRCFTSTGGNATVYITIQYTKS